MTNPSIREEYARLIRGLFPAVDTYCFNVRPNMFNMTITLDELFYPTQLINYIEGRGISCSCKDYTNYQVRFETVEQFAHITRIASLAKILLPNIQAIFVTFCIDELENIGITPQRLKDILDGKQ